MTQIKKLIVITGLALLFAGLHPLTVFGREEIKASISVMPVKIEPVIDKGSVYTTEIKIVNTGKQEARLSISVKDFSKTDSGVYKFYTLGSRSQAFSAAEWIRLSKDRQVMEPGSRVSVPLTIEVPEDAEAGTHYAMVFVSAEPVFESEELKKSYIVGVARIGCLALVTVKGKTVRSSDVSFSLSSFNIDPTVSFKIQFENKGNVHRDITGIVTMDEPRRNRKIEERASLPESTTTINGSFKDLPLAGKFRAAMLLRASDGGFWKREQTFYIIPVKQIAAAVLVVSLLVLGVSLFRGRFSIRLERKDTTTK